MKAQRKTGLHLETNVTSRSHCSPDDTGELRQYPVGKYSPGVLVGEWQKAAALQVSRDSILQPLLLVGGGGPVAYPGHLARGAIYMFHIIRGNFRQTYTNYRLNVAWGRP